jgi:hypothetical protein
MLYPYATNIGFVIVRLIIFLLWIGLALAALFSLRKRSLSDVATVLWTLIILFVPIAGALALWIVNPGHHADSGVG